MRNSEKKSRVFAKNLRGRMTNAEVILWSRLRRKIVHGRKFRRQHPIGPYIADFACVPACLIVEVDGVTHSTDAEVSHDQRRDTFLNKQGWRVMRIANEDIYENLDNVLEEIFRRVPPPRPSGGPPP